MSTQFLLIFSTALNFVASIVLVIYSYKIMRLDVTPEWTWSLKFAASILQVIGMLQSVFFIWTISTFLTQFPPLTLVVSYTIGGLRSVLLMAFVVRVYYTLTQKFGDVKHT